MNDYEKLEQLKEKVFSQNNRHCFIERERYLASHPQNTDRSAVDYAEILAGMLDSVSTPIDDCDIFVGRVVEGMHDDPDFAPSRALFSSKGHLSPDYEKLLRLGLYGILEEIRAYAARIGTEKARTYLCNAETVIAAVGRFAGRYGDAARKHGMTRAADALSRVPLEPAYDLYSALQSIWIMHLIASCYMGSRDYAFGYMDEYLYPYYLREKENGTTDDEIRTMLAGFFIKTDEICGRCAHNYRQKPIHSNSSKQYVLLDGGRANELSELILDGGAINCMAQPIFTVILSKDASARFTSKVFDAMAKLTDKLQVYNCELMQSFLRSKGLPERIVSRPSVSACCTFDIARYACREEFYLPTVQTFCRVLHSTEFHSKDALLSAFSDAITKEAQKYVDESHAPDYDWARMAYLFDSLLLTGCNESCEYAPYGLEYRAKNIFLPGIATLGDSLAVLDRLVFSGKVPYAELIKALDDDFVGHDALCREIAAVPRFGNDTEIDRYTTEMGDLLVSAVERVTHAENEIIAPSFYSLERENAWASETPATPDGRHSGTPFSENQSPVYGADRNGITALLCSLARLPFHRTAAGGLNLTFSSKPSAEILQALVKTYFTKGGMHVGITVLDRETLQDAMKHPEKYKSLTVRMYGFSEYFISLPEYQQIAVLNRTAY